MDLYLQLFLIFMLTYYLFFYKDKNDLKKRNSKKRNSKKKIIEKLSIPNYAQQYYLNRYDINDLNQSKPKRYYPLDFGLDYNKNKIKYLKAINTSLDQIRLLANKDQETIYSQGAYTRSYNVQNRNPIKIEGNPAPFQFFSKYLTDKLNDMGRNLYNVSFIRFTKIDGEEIDEQYKVNLDMEFNVKIKKESFGDKVNIHKFKVKSDLIINKPNPMLKIDGSVFIRRIFVDNKDVNDFRSIGMY